MKADSRYTISLCPAHHREQHATGDRSFAARYGLDLAALAAATDRAWRDHNA